MPQFNAVTGRMEDEMGNPVPESIPAGSVQDAVAQVRGPRPYDPANMVFRATAPDPGLVSDAVSQARAPVAREQPILSLIPPQPAHRDTKRTSTTTSQQRMGAEERQQVAAISSAADAGVQAARAQAEANQGEVRAKVAAADETAAYQAEREVRRTRLLEEGETQMQIAKAEYHQQYEKLKAMPIKDFWADAGTAKSIFAGIAMGLGELGKLAPGGRNVATEVIEGAVKADFAKQKLAIERQADILARSEKNLEIVESFRDKMLKNLDLKEAAAWDALKSRQEANLASAGAPMEAAKGDALVALAEQKKAEKLQNIFEGTRKQIASTVERAMVDNTGQGGGALTPYQQYQTARAEKQDAEAKEDKTNRRMLTDYDGNPIGEASSDREAEAAKKVLSDARVINPQLDALIEQVKDLGLKERAPVVGYHTEKQQKIRGRLEAIGSIINQTVGAGAPSGGEILRRFETLSASTTQSPEVAAENAKVLRDVLRDSYEQQAATLVKGYKPKGRPEQDGAVIKRVNGKRSRVYPDGTYEVIE